MTDTEIWPHVTIRMWIVGASAVWKRKIEDMAPPTFVPPRPGAGRAGRDDSGARLRLRARPAADHGRDGRPIARALEITADELLGMSEPQQQRPARPSRKILRRAERIENLPRQQQLTLLRTIDTFLKAASK
jgi:hypothetical protein